HTAAMRRLYPPFAQPTAPSVTAREDGNTVPAPAPADAADAADREWSLDELAEAYAYPAADDPVRAGRTGWLRANMVSSMDGAARPGLHPAAVHRAPGAHRRPDRRGRPLGPGRRGPCGGR